MVSDGGLGDSGDPTLHDFRLTPLTNPVVLVAGQTATLQVRVERAPGYTLPILIDLWSLPDGVDYVNRENRVGEDITTFTLHVSEDGAVGPIGVANYAIQGSDGTGLRESTPAHYEIIP